jgi:predicted DNA-binding WGR domain protein
MSDVAQPGSTPLQVILERVDPRKNVARYYVVLVQPSLFGGNTLIRHWGRIGSAGWERIELFDDAASAAIALETWLARKRAARIPGSIQSLRSGHRRQQR